MISKWSRFIPSLPLLLLIVVVLGEAAAILLLPKAISWDPSYGMLSARHYVAGRSPNILTRVEADPEDISRDKTERVRGWAPAYQVVPWLLRFNHFSWGTALNLTTFLCVLAGFTGWGMYFARTLPCRGAVWLMLALTLTRSTLMNAVLYSGGDLLLWSVAPLLILLNIAAMRGEKFSVVTGYLAAFAAGAGATGIYLVKYSGIFLGAGLFAAWVYMLYCRRVAVARAMAWALGAAAITLPIWLLGFTQTTGFTKFNGFRPLDAILSLGLWPEGVTGLEGMLVALLDHSKIGTGENRFTAASGLALLVLILISLAYSRLPIRDIIRKSRDPDSLVVALIVAGADIFCLASGIFAGSSIALDARLGRVSGLLLLPLLFEIWMANAAGSSGLRRAPAAVCIFLFLILPSIYGVTSDAPKFAAAYQSEAAAAGHEFVADYSLSPNTNLEQFYSELNRSVPDDRTVLYTTYPQMLFPIPSQRLILREAVELFSADELRGQHFRGSNPGGVALLLPRFFIDNRKLDAIESSFSGVHEWVFVPLNSDPFWGLWIGK